MNATFERSYKHLRAANAVRLVRAQAYGIANYDLQLFESHLGGWTVWLTW